KGNATEQLVIPSSALLWDEFGNTSVYVRSEIDSFRRQRVETGRHSGNQIVITRGLEAGAEVVSVGAESLHGQEFKGQAPVDDD
ncbi:MAG: hypothetical protein JWM11_6568, partial [Planctomycetaceae bacterium]|nr:hypothetical protein [Planctomycetaceae bacterium]